jgi:glycosyltransferase involved in cell wall biosynthesis
MGLVGTVFVYVGRLWAGKGIRPLLAAYRIVEKTYPQQSTLLMVGDGPELDIVRRAASTNNLSIHLAGFHQKKDLPRLYAASDVFVFPTLGDPYGLVVDEAMATGLPVISTTAAGEIRERVMEGINGLLVPPDDPIALAGAMIRLLMDPSGRERMGARSRELISPYSPQSWAADFTAAVHDIVRQTHAHEHVPSDSLMQDRR